VQPPSDEVTFVILPLLLVDILLELAPLPLVTLELAPPPLLTDTPGAPLPTVVWPDTCPLPALMDVDIPLGGFSPGFRCTTLHPFVFMSALLPLLALTLLLAALAAPTNANTAALAKTVVMILIVPLLCMRNCRTASSRPCGIAK
jgi:hypothetical protein